MKELSVFYRHIQKKDEIFLNTLRFQWLHSVDLCYTVEGKIDQ